MLRWLAVGVAVLVAIGLCAWPARHRRRPASLYLDVGAASPVFESRRYGIRAKPDKLERAGSDRGRGGRHGRRPGTEVTLVELKSRPRRRPHPSDVAQMIATTLAVRDAGLDVRAGRVETPAGTHPVDLDASDEALYRRIRPAVEIARRVVAGGEPEATPAPAKCAGCGYRARCPHAR